MVFVVVSRQVGRTLVMDQHRQQVQAVRHCESMPLVLLYTNSDTQCIAMAEKPQLNAIPVVDHQIPSKDEIYSSNRFFSLLGLSTENSALQRLSHPGFFAGESFVRVELSKCLCKDLTLLLGDCERRRILLGEAKGLPPTAG